MDEVCDTRRRVRRALRAVSAVRAVQAQVNARQTACATDNSHEQTARVPAVVDRYKLQNYARSIVM